MNMFSSFVLNLRNLKEKSFANILKRGAALLELDIVEEVKQYISFQQNEDGGFKNKAGQSDVYYSLFGYFLSKSLHLDESINLLKQYILNANMASNTNNIDGLCKTILFNELIGYKNKSDARKKAGEVIFGSTLSESNYFNFLALITLYSLKDFKSLNRVLKSSNHLQVLENMPTTVLVSNIILNRLKKENTFKLAEELQNRYSNGGYRASRLSLVSDMLSTATALYAMAFDNRDTRIIKDSAFEFITDLYEDGGFVATIIDTKPDIEYTFYGLLALGALNN